MRGLEWLAGLIKKGETIKLDDCISGDLVAEIFYKELAINSAINLIANTLNNAEFQTYDEGKEIRQENYYLFNVEPNQNMSASVFWQEVVYKLVYSNECLVVKENGMFYIVDSYEKKEFAFKDNLYTDIVINNYQLDKVYFEPDVFHFKLHSEKVKSLIDGLYKSYGKLITASRTRHIKKGTKRGILNIDSRYPQTEESQEDLNDLLSNRFKRFFKAEGDALLSLNRGLSYDELGEKDTNRGGGLEGRDIRAFIDDVFDFVAIAFQIPPQLLKGDSVDLDGAWDSFLTRCINPLAKMIGSEINRKHYSKEAYLKRCYLKIDTTRVKAVNIKDIANALDVLTRIGAYSVDDSLKALGMEPLNTDWSRVRWMTKNYEKIETMAKDMKGGE